MVCWRTGSFFAATLLACGPGVGNPAESDSDSQSGTGSGDNTDGESQSDTGNVDESSTGEPPPGTQQLVFLRTDEPFSEFTRASELKAVRTDGSDDRVLFTMPEDAIVSKLVGVQDDTVVSFYDLNGIAVGAAVFAALDGNTVQTIEDVRSAALWLDPSMDGVWVLDELGIEYKTFDGNTEGWDLDGPPYFLSPSREWVASSRSGDSALFDFDFPNAPISFEKVEIENSDPLCGTDASPGFWMNNAETRGFIYPGPDLTVQVVDFGDPDPVALDIADGFVPIGYDRCLDRMLGIGMNGVIYGVGVNGEIEALAESIGVAEHRDPFGFSPDGRYAITTVNGELRTAVVADLVAGTSSIASLGALGELRVGNVTANHAAIGSAVIDGEATAFAVELATGESTSASTCDMFGPLVTEQGGLVVCHRESDGVPFGIETGDGFAPVGDNATQIRILPSDPTQTACIDTEPTALFTTWCA